MDNNNFRALFPLSNGFVNFFKLDKNGIEIEFIDNKKVKNEMLFYINEDLNSIKYLEEFDFDFKGIFLEQKICIKSFNKKSSFYEFCEKIDDLNAKLNDTDYISYNTEKSAYTRMFTNEKSCLFMKYLTTIRKITIDKNCRLLLQMLLLLKRLFVDNSNFLYDLDLNTTSEYITSIDGKVFLINLAMLSSNYSQDDLRNIAKISKKIETTFIKKGHFSKTIFIILKWLEVRLYAYSEGSSTILYYPSLEPRLNTIIDLLIKLFINTKNIELLNDLYKIANKNFDKIEVLDYLLNYYSDINDLNKFEKALISLKKIEPFSSSIDNYNETLIRLKALNQLSSNFDYDNINQLSGIEFEIIVKNKFIELGFKADLTKISGDFGADIIVETNNSSRIAVQCKRFKSKVNLKAAPEHGSDSAHKRPP